MILIQEYKVSPDGKWLTINLKANPAITGAYIASVKISTKGDFTDTTDTSIAAFDLAIAAAGVDFSVHPTQINIRLDVDTIRNAPFYMMVTGPNISTSCAYKRVIYAVTFNKYPLYKALNCASKELDGCEPAQIFVDFLLRLKALEAAIAINDRVNINKYYRWLIAHGKPTTCGSSPTSTGTTSPCGCNH